MRAAGTDLLRLLGIGPGIVSLIGSGGKTTLMRSLAAAVPGTAVVCTSTRILPPEGIPVLTGTDPGAVRAALERGRVVCVGTPAPEGKLSAPGIASRDLARMAEHVFVEADGSRGRPLKAHAPWEPVIPDGTARTILVLGIDGIGGRIRDAAHRPERYAALAGCGPDETVTVEMAARALTAEGLGDLIFLNKVETADAWEDARALAARVDLPVVAGSLWEGKYRCWS